MATASSAVNTPPTAAGVAAARQGSRAARLSAPRTIDVLTEMAAKYDVCTHPVPLRMLNPRSLRTEVIDVRCGATLTAKCPACAARSKKLRQVQCRDGWHRTDEPITPQPTTEEHRALVLKQARNGDGGAAVASRW